MSTKTVRLRALAQQDVQDAIEYHRIQADEDVALGFVDAFQAALVQIGTHPESGSQRYGYELNLPGLRFWPLHRYPWLIFYMDTQVHADVWRVLHGKRELPASLGIPAEDR